MKVSIQNSGEFSGEKDPAIFEEINYYITCQLIFPTISYINIVKRVMLLAVIHMSLSVLVCLGLITLNS